jgi:hypothetical protein
MLYLHAVLACCTRMLYSHTPYLHTLYSHTLYSHALLIHCAVPTHCTHTLCSYTVLYPHTVLTRSAHTLCCTHTLFTHCTLGNWSTAFLGDLNRLNTTLAAFTYHHYDGGGHDSDCATALPTQPFMDRLAKASAEYKVGQRMYLVVQVGSTGPQCSRCS